MKMNNKKIIVFLLVIIIILIVLFSVKRYELMKNESEGKWLVYVVDNKTQKKVGSSTIVVTDINKKFTINSDTNVISLPQKPNVNSSKSKYPYGYTIITFSKGYLPRIDHNLTIGEKGITNILITLDKPEAFSNVSYTEFFHYASQISVMDFLNYYINDDN